MKFIIAINQSVSQNLVSTRPPSWRAGLAVQKSTEHSAKLRQTRVKICVKKCD